MVLNICCLAKLTDNKRQLTLSTITKTQFHRTLWTQQLTKHQCHQTLVCFHLLSWVDFYFSWKMAQQKDHAWHFLVFSKRTWQGRSYCRPLCFSLPAFHPSVAPLHWSHYCKVLVPKLHTVLNVMKLIFTLNLTKWFVRLNCDHVTWQN